MSGRTDQLRDLVLKIGATTKVVEKQATRHGSLGEAARLNKPFWE